MKSRRKRRGRGPFNLQNLHTRLFGEPFDGAHNAMADCAALLRVCENTLPLFLSISTCNCSGRPSASMRNKHTSVPGPRMGVYTTER